MQKILHIKNNSVVDQESNVILPDVLSIESFNTSKIENLLLEKSGLETHKDILNLDSVVGKIVALLEAHTFYPDDINEMLSMCESYENEPLGFVQDILTELCNKGLHGEVFKTIIKLNKK